MSDVNTTITIKKSIKEDFEKCKDFSYEHWNDCVKRVVDFYLKYYPIKKKEE